ncbi:LemA family protein [Paracraurococcus lichenis]|uniref:LemA family protein n=1 Tax=Paracraurococcus lichenis TaxID=3064888 RepID=A0ABT9DVA4_9PROT|nr:LemA family protein [Paracraurococcus sp. LOR1-02]MDO9707808.1 LemA family protein [Paracraurococcus sp. LOR1-02]
MSGWWILGCLVLLLVLLAWLYNGLVAARNRVRNAWAQIDVQLLRRSDLIPDLVESVKGYMRHEAAIFDRILEARRQAVGAGGNVAARAAAEGTLGREVQGLMALAEAVPELRASDNMKALQEELATTENRIAFARQFFNDAVLDYNTRIQTVPSSLLAGPFGFAPEPYFEAPAEARAKPKVSF